MGDQFLKKADVMYAHLCEHIKHLSTDCKVSAEKYSDWSSDVRIE